MLGGRFNSKVSSLGWWPAASFLCPSPPAPRNKVTFAQMQAQGKSLCISYKDVDPARPGPALWPHLTFITSLIFQKVFLAVLGLC